MNAILERGELLPFNWKKYMNMSFSRPIRPDSYPIAQNSHQLVPSRCEMLDLCNTSVIGVVQTIYCTLHSNLRTHFPSVVKKESRPSFGLMLFLIRPKLSAISRRGSRSNFFILPNSLF